MNLQKILKEHSDWLESGGVEGARANLRGCSGNQARIKSLFVSERYPITYTSGRFPAK